MSTHDEKLVNVKVHTRQLSKQLAAIRRSLDAGDCKEYEILDKCDILVKQINVDLRNMGEKK